MVRLVAALLLLAPVSRAGQPRAPMTDLPHQLDDYLQRVARRGFSGAVLVADHGNVVVAAAFGLADSSRGQPNTRTTVFDIGSITKQFTAAAMVLLEAEGRLRLSDSLGRYFPEAPPDKASITLHQLLTHTGGLDPDFASSDQEPLDRAEFLQRVFRRPLRFPPGARYSYSNGGYSLLAAVLEQVTGASWQLYLRDHLFRPAGLEHTGFFNDPQFDSASVAIGHMNGQATGNPAKFAGPYWGVIGNGEVLSTVDDLFAWVRALERHTALTEAATAPIHPARQRG